MRRLVGAACALILLAACSATALPTGSSTPMLSPSSPPLQSPTPVPATPPASVAPAPTAQAATPTAAACNAPSGGVYPHQAPEIEALLPATVAGRTLTRWSVRGRCELTLLIGTPADIDPFVVQFTTPSNPNPIDDTNLVYGVDGRLNLTDPPFFIYAAARPLNNDEVALALYLLFGGAGFYDTAGATDLTTISRRRSPANRLMSARSTCSVKTSTSAADRSSTRTTITCSW